MIRAFVAAALLFVAAVSDARATLRDQIGFTQNLGDSLPRDVALRNADGAPTSLRQALDGRPAVLVFGYYDCPELCGVTAEGVISTLRRIEPSVGRDFDFIYLSISPLDTPEKSRLERAGAARRYGRGDSTAGWHYLTGDTDAIATLTSAAGFRYRPSPNGRDFAHPSGFLVVSPGGTISRYFIGIDFDPAEIARALRAAADERTGSPVADFLIACLHGGAPGQARWPWVLMQFAVVASLVGLAYGIFKLVRGERPRPRARADSPGSA